ncbi:MAG: MIP/aquaporin family protein [Actinomycetota bacterium]
MFLGEVVGTGTLILLGDGVVAGVLLNKSKAQNGGWIVITWAWGMAVTFGILTSVACTGGVAHLNPAVTIAWAFIGNTEWADVPQIVAGEFLGAMLGALLVFLAYMPHWAETEDPGLKLAVHSTGPAIRNYPLNLLTEVIATMMLTLCGLAIGQHEWADNFGALFWGLLVLSLGLSLGGPTGYAMNPARDLGPRIMHFILPIPGKGSSDWAYSMIPVFGPLVGGTLGAFIAKAAFDLHF